MLYLYDYTANVGTEEWWGGKKPGKQTQNERNKTYKEVKL